MKILEYFKHLLCKHTYKNRLTFVNRNMQIYKIEFCMNCCKNKVTKVTNENNNCRTTVFIDELR